MASDGLPYLIGNYVVEDGNSNDYFGNCESYARNQLLRTNANLGFVKYPNRTWRICRCSGGGTDFHYMRKNEDGTWSQKIDRTITNCFAKKNELQKPYKQITDSNIKEAFKYAGFEGGLTYSDCTQA